MLEYENVQYHARCGSVENYYLRMEILRFGQDLRRNNHWKSDLFSGYVSILR